MARPIYPHELTDPDFQWLMSTYKETHPHVFMVEMSCLPVLMVVCTEVVVRRDCEMQIPRVTGTVPQTGDLIPDLADEQDF